MHALLAVQWVVFHLGGIITLSYTMGIVLSLSQQHIGLLMQLSFFITGIASMSQLRWGHKTLALEGPGALWMSAYIFIAGVGFNMGKPASIILTDISGAMIISGLILALLGALGFIKKILKYFTSRVTGVLLMLIAIQVGGVAVKGLIENGLVQFFIGIIILILVISILLKAKGLAKSSALLIGIIVGWLLCIITGTATVPSITMDRVFTPPQLFPWGTPTFDLGTILTIVFIGLFVIPIMVGSISAMEKATGDKGSPKKFDRSLLLSGLSNFGTGILGGHGTVTYAISAGFVSVTGNKEQRPFYLAALLFVVMGLLAPLGSLVGNIPSVLISSVLLVPAVSVLEIGTRSIVQEENGPKEVYIVGLSLLVGIGVMLLPAESLQDMPNWLASLVGNGVIVGAFIAFTLEFFNKSFS